MDSICVLFKLLSENVWDKIARNNKRGLKLGEDGITRNTIISDILDYIEDHRSNRVFAQLASKEAKRGGDLEIYLEAIPGYYVRFFLQAKILKPDGYYHNVGHKVGGSGPRQWDLLEQYSRIAGCVPYYLFYNGIDGFTIRGKDCAGYYNEKQFGIAISKVNRVKDFCTKYQTNNVPCTFIINTKNPQGRPWRILPCCSDSWGFELSNPYSRILPYTANQIDMDPHFDEIFSDTSYSHFTGDANDKSASRVGYINHEIHNRKWSPIGRILISEFGLNIPDR